MARIQTEDFGAVLKRRRQARAWSQFELAMASKVSLRTIQRIERGTTKSPGLSTATALAEAFSLTLPAFLAAAK